MTNSRRFCQLVITFGVIAALQAAPNTRPAPFLHLSAEDESVADAVPLPAGALKVLATDPEVKQRVPRQGKEEHESGQPRRDQLTQALFSARAVHLNGRDERDFLVMGVGSLRGANVSPFWVLRPTADGYNVILTVAAHDVEVREGIGYPDIRAYAATAVQVHTMRFRFRDGSYRLSWDKWEAIKK